jgi:TPR repeat protein
MISTEALFRIGDAAQEAGEHERARRAFEQGAALGDVWCLLRLAYMFDIGLGVAVDKPFAMRCYQRAWRRGHSEVAANNIAILYREAGKRREMFRWFLRAAELGDDGAQVDLAKCYLAGIGVRKSVPEALRRLAAAVSGANICEAEREEAAALLAQLRPRLVVNRGG